jgi:hypothetical protein
MSPKYRRRAPVPVYAAAATLLFLAAAEVVVRFGGWAELPTERFFTSAYDPQFALQAEALNPFSKVEEFLNQSGFRGPDLSPTKRPATWRIISAGDSVCFGFGVAEEETYTRLLEGELRRRNVAVETLNAGVPGTALWQQRALIEKRLLAYQPDLLILYTQPSFRADHAAWRDMQNGWPAALRQFQSGLARSHLYRLLRRGLRPPRFADIVSQYYSDRAGAAPRDLVFQQAHDDLLSVRDRCRAFGVRLLVAPVLPRQLFDDARRAGAAPDGPGWSDFVWRYDGLRPFKRDVQDLEIPILDAAPGFVAAGDPAALFIDDCHFTAAGHALMARLLADRLCGSDLLPRRCQ